MTDVRGLEQLQRSYGPFADALEHLLGRPVEFTAVSDRTAAIAALQYDQVDVVLTGPLEYVLLKARVPTARIVVGVQRPGYSACIYTSSLTGIDSLEGLRNRRIAMGDVGSTSGHLGPSLLISRAGLNPRSDVEIFNLGISAHEALVRGEVSAVGIGCHEYERATKNSASEWVLIARGELLPPDVIVVRPGISSETSELLRETLTSNWSTLLPHILSGDDTHKFANSTIVDATDPAYDQVREMLRVFEMAG